MNKLKDLAVVALAVTFAASSAISLAAEPAASNSSAIVVAESMYAKATITKIDKKTRELTLRDEQGSEFTVVAGEEVRNFPQIKKGDIVEVEYHEAAATMLEKASDATVAGHTAAVERAPAGGKPGMRATRTSSIVATVLEIDQQKREVTLQGPRGGIVKVAVPADMKAFDTLKKGDKVSAVYTEAVAISVKTPTKKK